MAKLSIEVKVAGRSYPLSIEESEKEKVLSAAADINKAIKLLQDNYAVKDMQDLLAMTSLQLATKDNSNDSKLKDDSLFEKIEEDLMRLVNETNL